MIEQGFEFRSCARASYRLVPQQAMKTLGKIVFKQELLRLLSLFTLTSLQWHFPSSWLVLGRQQTFYINNFIYFFLKRTPKLYNFGLHKTWICLYPYIINRSPTLLRAFSFDSQMPTLEVATKSSAQNFSFLLANFYCGEMSFSFRYVVASAYLQKS